MPWLLVTVALFAYLEFYNATDPLRRHQPGLGAGWPLAPYRPPETASLSAIATPREDHSSSISSPLGDYTGPIGATCHLRA